MILEDCICFGRTVPPSQTSYASEIGVSPGPNVFRMNQPILSTNGPRGVGSDGPGYVMRLNLHRRRLSSEERRVLYLKLRELRGVQKPGGDRGNQYTGGNRQNCLMPTQAKYASEIGVSHRTVKDWESDAKVLDKSPVPAMLWNSMGTAMAVTSLRTGSRAPRI